MGNKIFQTLSLRWISLNDENNNNGRDGDSDGDDDGDEDGLEVDHIQHSSSNDFHLTTSSLVKLCQSFIC